LADAPPWDKDQQSSTPCRGATIEHSQLPSSQTAPFATSTNFEEQKQAFLYVYHFKVVSSSISN
jgi:hypothetical protein